MSQRPHPGTSWGEILGDTTVAAAALLDRLLHRSVVLDITGESYRLRDHHARANTQASDPHHPITTATLTTTRVGNFD
jgi:hypothetical protein